MRINKERMEYIGSPPTYHLSCLAQNTLDVLGLQRGEALIVGTHPVLNQDKAKVGDELLDQRRFPAEKRTHIVGQPQQTLQQLRELVRHNFKRFPLVISAFESHHFQGPDVEEFFNIVGDLSYGTVIAADYTLAGLSSDAMKDRLDSRIERMLQACYGSYEAWFHAHASFTAQSFVHSVERSADWISDHAFLYGKSKAGVLVSQDISQPEMELIKKHADIT